MTFFDQNPAGLARLKKQWGVSDVIQKFRIIFVIKNNVDSPLANLSYEISVKPKDGSGKATASQRFSNKTRANGETVEITLEDKDQDFLLKINGRTIEARDGKKGKYSYSEDGSFSGVVFEEKGGKKYSYHSKKIEVRLKAFTGYQIMLHNKPLVGVSYSIYDKDNKKILSDKTTAKGMTGFPYVDSSNYVEVNYFGQKFKSPLNLPLATSSPGTYHVFALPFSSTSTHPKETYTASLGSKEILPIVISPHTNEIYVLPQEVFEPFDKLSKDFERSISKIYSAREELKLKLEAKDPTDIKKIEEKLGIAQKEALQKLNGEFSKPADIREVFVIEASGSNGQPNLLRRYISVQRAEDLRGKKINKFATSLKMTGPVSSRQGAEKISSATPQEFKDSLKKFTEDFNLELAKAKKPPSKAIYDLYLPVLGRLGGEYANQYSVMGEDDLLTVEAQWLRLVGTNGAEASLSISKKHISGKAKAQAAAKFVLFEGQADWNFFFPSKYGWGMQFLEQEDVCRIRFIAGIELNGFAGANIALNGQVAVEVGQEDGKQVLRAIRNDPATTMQNAVRRGRGAISSMEVTDKKPGDDVGNQASVTVDAFAGAQVSATPKLELQWFNVDSNAKEKDGINFKYSTLAKASFTLGASIGAAAGFNLYVYLHEGKIRLKVAAHLCWGAGAKGKLDFTVNSAELLEFAGFIYFQLLKTGFKLLTYIAENAFMLLSQVLAMLAATTDIGWLKDAARYMQNGQEKFAQWLKTVEKEEEKLKCAQNINNNLAMLARLTPNAKGILVHSLCHWNTRLAHVDDLPAVDMDGVHFMDQRKTAIVNIFKSVLKVEEWRNVIQHTTALGEKCNTVGKTPGEIERHIINFLAYGLSWKTGSMETFNVQQVVDALNTGRPYTGPTNKWIVDFIKARRELEGVVDWPLHQIALNQDDPVFKQVKMMQGYANSDEQLYLAVANDIPQFGDDYGRRDGSGRSGKDDSWMV
ncbi:hypothetical protein [Acinetobacter gyllenbergii]|uniref:hypothetical protein n=1 Tax=Acinetobacter gyllenbergii TaxID=134534 RepID=UPI000806B356|nr:hypothetical protein [Acinetobacter gyllenbergii]